MGTSVPEPTVITINSTSTTTLTTVSTIKVTSTTTVSVKNEVLSNKLMDIYIVERALNSEPVDFASNLQYVEYEISRWETINEQLAGSDIQINSDEVLTSLRVMKMGMERRESDSVTYEEYSAFTDSLMKFKGAWESYRVAIQSASEFLHE